MKAEIGFEIERAKEILKSGGLVAIPTETVYGLAANGFDGQAVARIFLAKNRPNFNPLILHVADIGAAKSLTKDWPPLATRLAEAFWPGPLTLLLPRSKKVPDLVTAGSPLVAVRMPSHPLALSLLATLDFPLAAPSANPSGYISPTSPQHVFEQLGDQIPYILDGGHTTVGIESTIIGFSEEGAALLYRLGGQDIAAIEAITGPLAPAKKENHKPATPGRLERHYAPLTSFELGKIDQLIPQFKEKRIGILSFSKERPNVDSVHQRILSVDGDTVEAAHNLFRMMRELDALDLDVILAEKAPDQGLGPAINDRLHRASYDSRI